MQSAPKPRHWPGWCLDCPGTAHKPPNRVLRHKIGIDDRLPRSAHPLFGSRQAVKPRQHPANILKASDFIPPDQMPLSLRLEEITPSVYGGITVKKRDKLRKKYGLQT